MQVGMQVFLRFQELFCKHQPKESSKEKKTKKNPALFNAKSQRLEKVENVKNTKKKIQKAHSAN